MVRITGCRVLVWVVIIVQVVMAFRYGISSSIDTSLKAGSYLWKLVLWIWSIRLIPLLANYIGAAALCGIILGPGTNRGIDNRNRDMFLHEFLHYYYDADSLIFFQYPYCFNIALPLSPQAELEYKNKFFKTIQEMLTYSAFIWILYFAFEITAVVFENWFYRVPFLMLASFFHHIIWNEMAVTILVNKRAITPQEAQTRARLRDERKNSQTPGKTSQQEFNFVVKNNQVKLDRYTGGRYVLTNMVHCSHFAALVALNFVSSKAAAYLFFKLLTNF